MLWCCSSFPYRHNDQRKAAVVPISGATQTRRVALTFLAIALMFVLTGCQEREFEKQLKAAGFTGVTVVYDDDDKVYEATTKVDACSVELEQPLGGHSWRLDEIVVTASILQGGRREAEALLGIKNPTREQIADSIKRTRPKCK